MSAITATTVPAIVAISAGSDKGSPLPLSLEVVELGDSGDDALAIAPVIELGGAIVVEAAPDIIADAGASDVTATEMPTPIQCTD
jgi:hypothetical protein